MFELRVIQIVHIYVIFSKKARFSHVSKEFCLNDFSYLKVNRVINDALGFLRKGSS